MAAARAASALGGAVALTVVLAVDAAAQSSSFAPNPPRGSNQPGYILEQAPDRLPEATTQCVFFRTVYDWRPLNNYNLIVWAPGRNSPYHIQLDRPCRGLRFAASIGFTSRDSRLCAYGGDSVIVDAGGGIPERCPIGAITKLTPESLKALLAQAPGRSRADRQAADGEGGPSP